MVITIAANIGDTAILDYPDMTSQTVNWHDAKDEWTNTWIH